MTKPVTIEDLKDFAFYGNLKAKGDRILFIQARIDEKKDRYSYNLMQYHFGAVKQMTSRDCVSSFVFKDDSTAVFAMADPDDEKKTVLMELPLDGGEAIQTGVIDLDHAGLICINDEFALLTHTDYLCEKETPEHEDYEVLDELPWYVNGQGFTNKKRNHLYILDRHTGELCQLAKGYSCDQAEYDQKTETIYFSGNPDGISDFDTNGLYKIPVNPKNPSQPGPVSTLVEEGVYGIMGFKPVKDTILFFASDYKQYGLNENPMLYELDLSSGEYKLAAHWDEGLGNTIGTDCAVVGGNTLCVHDDELYFTSTIVEHNTLFKYKDGAMHQVFAWPGSIHSFGFCEDKLYFIGAAPNELQQLYEVLDGEAGTVKCLSDFNSQLSDHYIAEAKPVFYKNHAGQEQMGWVLYPKDFDPAKSYPGILDIHGGPKTVYGTIFYHEMQMWASKGYFVFFCNPYGSDGQGNAYAYMKDKYGTDDYTDLMNFTDAVLQAIPNIDAKRLGVTGGSYGGFMTNWIVGHTDRFSAAATQRSISNWISFYGTSDIGPDFVKDQQGCGLENIQQLWDHSPLKYIQNVKTPTLIIHSDEDYRCPLEQGMQMLTGILEQNVPARLVLFHGENHDLSRTGKPSHRVRRLEEITKWMETYAPVNEE